MLEIHLRPICPTAKGRLHRTLWKASGKTRKLIKQIAIGGNRTRGGPSRQTSRVDHRRPRNNTPGRSSHIQSGPPRACTHAEQHRRRRSDQLPEGSLLFCGGPPLPLCTSAATLIPSTFVDPLSSICLPRACVCVLRGRREQAFFAAPLSTPNPYPALIAISRTGIATFSLAPSGVCCRRGHLAYTQRAHIAPEEENGRERRRIE